MPTTGNSTVMLISELIAPQIARGALLRAAEDTKAKQNQANSTASKVKF